MRNTGIATSATPPRAGTVEVLVGLLAELDEATESGVFYDRVCRAVCSLTTMRRAALLLHDNAYRTVIPMGSYGVDPALLSQLEGTLEETPIARMALEEDRVVEVSGNLAPYVPARYAEVIDSRTITCTPIAAARRWLGIIVSDRGGEGFVLAKGERETMLTLGRLAALTASVERSTERRESERRLSERVELTRDLHENAIQRLFGVALALGSAQRLSAEEQRRCREELRSVVGDLRRALTRPVATRRGVGKARLAEVLERLRVRRPELRLDWQDGVAVPPDLEPLAQSVLAEALRNMRKHAEPERVEILVDAVDGALVLEVGNDGLTAGSGAAASGMGLRLASFEALQHGGVLEFGETEPGWWRVRLVVPID
jgi:signal transduction histidine kinase